MRAFALSVAGLASALLFAACTGSGADPRWVELRGERFTVEIADDDASRARGLMFRDHLPDGHGMLFIHDREEPQAFWMKNTRIPLDILYFDDRRRLVSMAQRVPPCSAGDRCPSYPSERPARYTLELNAGTAARLGVRRGDELKFGPGIAAE
ncbi:DUF192 domain-containing protein [Rehaibacterium terrae]|jgi:uncharacterized membrane protein (UPF0127 family)|uniref:DUF192 domain-containing protein n=1 Tax=Rehaibacterium terrae TaxID=1341696 RepID=A0A7W7Y1Z3_9GAMM|nr:DUF192 domain-containing protein [Rehaibacterium terrae]MBB5016627.1 hypothetical protein [Rehaibacterium terrae]